MSTDDEWRRWGEQDPYFAVITNPKFRAGNLNDAVKKEFFGSGQHHARYVLETCRRQLDPAFNPKQVLDFGCGVGRVLVALAKDTTRAVGVDVSPAMLAEARKNCDQHGLTQVELAQSDDTLSQVQGQFDLVHSCIVLQHIDVHRGREIFGRLIDLVAPSGIGAIQVTYAKSYLKEPYGQPAPPPAAPSERPTGGWLGLLRRGKHAATDALRRPVPTTPAGDPEMLMNAYNLNELVFQVQRAGVQKMHVGFTDHGGEWGVFLFFKKPSPATPAR